jgi:hypothetical protein
MVATASAFQWKDLKYITYAVDSANLTDSAYSIKNPQIIGVHYKSGAIPVYAGPGLAPSEIIDGQHEVILDFEAQITGVKPFFTMMGVTDTGYWSTNIQSVFYIDLNFYGADSSTFQLKYRAKNCRFASLDMTTRHGEELKMRGSIQIGDIKTVGTPTTD